MGLLTNLSTFSQVYNKLCPPSSVIAIGEGVDDMSLVVGMLDGLVQFHKRKEDNVVGVMRTDNKRYKKAESHNKYLKHTQFTPSPGDQVVAEGSKDIELRHDFLLRKVEYSRA